MQTFKAWRMNEKPSQPQAAQHKHQGEENLLRLTTRIIQAYPALHSNQTMVHHRQPTAEELPVNP